MLSLATTANIDFLNWLGEKNPGDFVFLICASDIFFFVNSGMQSYDR